MKCNFFILIVLSIILVGCKSDSDLNVSVSSASKTAYKNESKLSYNQSDESLENVATPSKTKTFPAVNESNENETLVKQVDSDINYTKTENNKITSNSSSKRKKVEKQNNERKGKMKFNQLEYNFGFIEQGEVVDHSFYFKNIGYKDVNISNATASCGCTTPVYSFLPIEPNDSGKIDVRFNSKGRLGSQQAIITVFSDAEDETIKLKLTGIVRAKIAEQPIVDSLK